VVNGDPGLQNVADNSCASGYTVNKAPKSMIQVWFGGGVVPVPNQLTGEGRELPVTSGS